MRKEKTNTKPQIMKTTNDTTLQVNNVNTPNIFSYATSELSQDAFFCWLIAWAKPEFRMIDESLNNTAKDFIRLVARMPNLDIRNVDVDRQWKHIDVWAEINEDLFILIEDKTFTSEHGDQLARYKKEAEDHYGNTRKICGAYVKTGNESVSTLNNIKAASGFNIVERCDIINVLKSYKGDNIILLNFLEHLCQLEEDTCSFMSQKPSDWSWNAWQGFYRALQMHLPDAPWDYVANPAGGFLGLWWHFNGAHDADAEIYLQIEQGDICFKIYCEDETLRSETRNKYYQRLMELCADEHPEICRPARFGTGTWMTIAKVAMLDFLGDSLIDINAVIAKIRIYEGLVDKCASEI